MEITHVRPSPGADLRLGPRSALGAGTDVPSRLSAAVFPSNVALRDGPGIEDPGVAASVTAAHDHADRGEVEDGREKDRREIRGAIAMVTKGFAIGIVLCGLHDPETAAASLATEAADAGLRLRLAPNANGIDVEVRRL